MSPNGERFTQHSSVPGPGNTDVNKKNQKSLPSWNLHPGEGRQLINNLIASTMEIKYIKGNTKKLCE